MREAPIYLFADSQLLFWEHSGVRFASTIVDLLPRDSLRAAYVGASNGDDPAYFSIFEATMESVGARDCRQILSSFSDEDRLFISDSNIILLAGGDVQVGWNVLVKTGLAGILVDRHLAGALLIGVSAGAIHLGSYGYPDGAVTSSRVFDTLKLVPFAVGAHEEQQGWQNLKSAIRALRGEVRGIGIPTGGGVIYNADNETLEPVRHPIHELSFEQDEIVETVLFPQKRYSE